MRKIQTKQLENLELTAFDFVFTSSGYEDRCKYIPNQYNLLFKDATKICFSFNKLSIHNNNFEKLGYEIISGNGDDDFFVERILKQRMIPQENIIKIIVDYSSMTRVWYAAILRFFYNSPLYNVQIKFVYSFSKYLPPPLKASRNVHVRPLDGYSTFSIPDKPTALIIGLGYEPEKANGLSEFFDAETFLLYNDNSMNNEFSSAVEKINESLLLSTPSENIFRYPIDNLALTEKIVTDICRVLNEKYRIVIAPTGPKPFTLISLICALKQKNIDVWRVSAGENALPMNRKANGKISILEVSINNNF